MTTQPHAAVAGGPQPSQIQTQKPFVAFQPGSVPPSQALYFQENDVLFLRFIANSQYRVNFNYRYLTPQGEIKEGQAQLVTQGLSVQTFQIPLGEAWLLSFAFTTNNNLGQFSWIHAQVSVVRGQPTSFVPPSQGMLWEGYINSAGAAGLPGDPSKQVWDGPGNIRVVFGSGPAAGAEINEVVPSLRRWRLLSLKAQLVSSATVANRQPAFFIDDGSGNEPCEVGSSFAQVASTVQKYNLMQGQTFYNDGNSHIVIPFPLPIDLNAGMKIRTLTTGIQAGDQWSAPIYQILEWGEYDP